MACVCLGLTFMTIAFFLGPIYGLFSMYQGANFWFHLIVPLAEKDPVFGQLSENKNKGKKPSYLMVKAGTWGEDACQLHRFFSLKDVKIHGKAPYKIKAGDCFASETALKGSISISEEEDLKFTSSRWTEDFLGYSTTKERNTISTFQSYIFMCRHSSALRKKKTKSYGM